MTKHKLFARALYAVMALALVAGTLVPVARVSAVTSATVANVPETTSTAAEYTIAFNISIELSAGADTITITFPSDTYVPPSIAKALVTVNTEDASAVSSSTGDRTVIITVPETLQANAEVTVVIAAAAGVKNPSTAATDWKLKVRTNREADVDSGTYSTVAAPVSFKVVTGTADTVTAGTAFNVTVTAKDGPAGTGSTVTGYSGDQFITFTSAASDPKTIPAFETVNFTDGEGITSTSFVLNVVETGKTITATDEALDPDVTGTSVPITISAGAAHHLTITGAPTSVVADVAFSADVTVTAEDVCGNPITDYASNVTWSGGGADAILAANYTFVSGDVGVHAFAGSEFTLKEVGDQIITVTDSDNSTIAGEAPITVTLPASKLAVVASSGNITADGYDSSTITATAQDKNGTTVTSYGADITFQTSVGGFTETDGASTYTVAAVDAEGVADGDATATLTSTDAGVATIKVTSGSLTYATTAVNLTAPGKATEVWVDDDYSGEGDDGGHDWGYDAFATIEGGTDAVAAGGTVNVLPGTYVLANTINISTAGITLQSTAGAATTVINATALTAVNVTGVAILIDALGVTVDGFTVKDASSAEIYLLTAGGATISNNVISNDTARSGGIGIDLSTSVATAVTISGNTLCDNGSIVLHCSLATVTGNAIGRDVIIAPVAGQTITGTTITNNTFPVLTDNAVNGAAQIWGGPSGADAIVTNTTITGNTLANRDAAGLRIGSSYGGQLDIVNLTVTGNTITNNGADGVYINADVDWLSGNTINNNNIYGNFDYGIRNLGAEIIDAENNWWGDDSGPYNNSTNTAGMGDVVSDAVDYRPWLTAEYAEPAAPVTTYDITLEADWNLISLPLIPTNSNIETVLADLIGAGTVIQVRTWVWEANVLVEKAWLGVGSGDLITMVDGQGYWIEMNAAGALVVTGSELPAPPQTPPSYDVCTGWNLIGFKSVLTTQSATDYLGSMVISTMEAMYGYDAAASAYTIIQATTPNLAPGDGYWLAVNADGTIYP